MKKLIAVISLFPLFLSLNSYSIDLEYKFKCLFQVFVPAKCEGEFYQPVHSECVNATFNCKKQRLNVKHISNFSSRYI